MKDFSRLGPVSCSARVAVEAARMPRGSWLVRILLCVALSAARELYGEHQSLDDARNPHLQKLNGYWMRARNSTTRYPLNSALW